MKSENDRMYETGQAVVIELSAASHKFPPFNSAHEGFAVLHEEVDELWDEVKKRHRSKAKMRAEAIQVAAMAMRFIMDCCDGYELEHAEAQPATALHRELPPISPRL